MSNNNTNKNEDTNSVVLDLENLSNLYDTTLIKYQQAITDYTNSIQNKNNQYKILRGNAFWGTGYVGSQSVYTNINSPSDCQALCSKTTGCTGATFNQNNNGMNSCFLRSGDGSLVPTNLNDYAIVPLTKTYLLNMKNLNKLLTEINDKILNIIETKGKNMYNLEEVKRSVNGKDLQENYNKLIKEREEIEYKLNSFQDVEEQENNSELITNSNYMTYVLLLIIAILCIYIFIKVSAIFSFSNENTPEIQYGGRLQNKTYYIIFLMIFFILFIYYYKNLQI